MTPKMITSTALSLIVAMGATTASAQSNTTGNTTDGSSDQAIMEKIEAADAPDTAETDPVNETASNEIGSTNRQMGQSSQFTTQSGGNVTVMDLQSLSHDIYERGYRQGYIRGVQEARQDFAMQLNYLAKREQLVEKAENWESNQTDGSGSQQARTNGQTGSQTGAMGNMQGSNMGSGSGQTRMNGQNGQMAGQSNDQTTGMNNTQGSNNGSASGQAQMNTMQMQENGSGSANQQAAANTAGNGTSGMNPNINPRSQMMGARPGGTVVILPDGMSPEQFIEQLVNNRNNGSMTNSGG